MIKVTPMKKKARLSYDEYNDRYSGQNKRNKQKRGGKHRLSED